MKPRITSEESTSPETDPNVLCYLEDEINNDGFKLELPVFPMMR